MGCTNFQRSIEECYERDTLGVEELRLHITFESDLKNFIVDQESSSGWEGEGKRMCMIKMCSSSAIGLTG